MKKLAIACLLILSSTVVIAGSREVAPVSSGSASSTFSVGVPHFSATRGAAAPAAKGGPAAQKKGGGKAAAKKGGGKEDAEKKTGSKRR